MRGFSRSMNVKNSYLVLCVVFIFIYLIKKQRSQDAIKCLSFEEMVGEKVNEEDDCLVNYVKNRRTCYPSTLQYNLTTRIDKKIGYVTPLTPLQSFLSEKDAPWIEALIAVETFVPKREQRHFLECGAIDGVTFSTTLHLERFLNWTGILIEADDRFYSDLKRVHRRAYGVHACVSRDPHPSMALFKPSPIYVPSTFLGHNVTKVNPGTGYLVSQHRSEPNGSDVDFIEVKCIPIYTVLLAVNITNIDLFVLDIEGVELEVLKTLPFEKVNVAIFMIEMAGKPENERELLRMFLQSKGYIFYDSLNGGMHPGDEIFIKDKYYKGEEDIRKLKMLTPRDIFKIVTGSKDEDLDSNDLKSFVMASHPVFGHLVT